MRQTLEVIPSGGCWEGCCCEKFGNAESEQGRRIRPVTDQWMKLIHPTATKKIISSTSSEFPLPLVTLKRFHLGYFCCVLLQLYNLITITRLLKRSKISLFCAEKKSDNCGCAEGVKVAVICTQHSVFFCCCLTQACLGGCDFLRNCITFSIVSKCSAYDIVLRLIGVIETSLGLELWHL